jgi:Zn-dependent protease
VERFRIPIGAVFGIRLWLHATWFAVLGLVTWAAVAAFGEAYPDLPIAERAAMGIVTGVAFFVCLLIHEFSHALMARRFQIEVRGITLFLFGGVAEISGEVPTAAREFAVALVGPATSLLLGGILGLGANWATDRSIAGAEGVLFTLAVVNVGVALFNLVPGLPLDGGRLLRAALWRVSGDFTKATKVAAAAGRVLAVALLALGAVLVLTGNGFGVCYGAIAAFLWLLAGRSGRVLPPDALALHGEGRAAPSES